MFLWLALTLIGAYSANAVSKRWLEQFSIPGYSAYEANQRALKTFGTGENAPLVAVFHSNGDITKVTAIRPAIAAAAKQNPGSRVSSYFSTGSDADAYVSRDRHTTFAELYPPGNQGFNGKVKIKEARAALKRATPAGVQSYLTGRDALQEASSGGNNNGPSVFLEAVVGGLGALVILLFVFGTVPAVLIPIGIAISSILNTFTLIYLLTYITSVSLIVQFLVAGRRDRLLVADDLPLPRGAGERGGHRDGADRNDATRRALGDRLGLHGRDRPALDGDPAHSRDQVDRNRRHADPGRFGVDLDHAAAGAPRDARTSDQPAAGDAEAHRRAAGSDARVLAPLGADRRQAADSGRLGGNRDRRDPACAGSADQSRRGSAQGLPGQGRRDQWARSARTSRHLPWGDEAVRGADRARWAGRNARGGRRRTPGIAAAVAPPQWRRDGDALVEAFPTTDSASSSSSTTISRLQHDVLPSLTATATLGGISPEDRDFVHAVYGKFPYVLAFVILLTFVLLMRAFRSILLPLKAVVLNLVSLGAAYGIIVFIFQWGHGSDAIWGVPATGAIISWIPLMIFAFLYGLSMDYEVFMLSRMREIYDETGDTVQAISLGLARTGKLVTSAALVLMFAFFVLSSSPGVDIKQFGIGLAAGIIFDATVIRALLVPAVMALMGRWNWWLPAPLARLFRVPVPAPSLE